MSMHFASTSVVPQNLIVHCGVLAGKADYFGSTVNRAARVFAAAQAGQVCVAPFLLDIRLHSWQNARLMPTAVECLSAYFDQALSENPCQVESMWSP